MTTTPVLQDGHFTLRTLGRRPPFTIVAVKAGVVIGLVGAFAASRLLGPYLFGVKPLDPLTFGAVLPLLVFVSAVASWLPARIASRTNPATVLRRDS